MTANAARDAAGMTCFGTLIAQLFDPREFTHRALIRQHAVEQTKLALPNQLLDHRPEKAGAASAPSGKPALAIGAVPSQRRPARVDQVETGRVDAALGWRQTHVAVQRIVMVALVPMSASLHWLPPR